MYAGRLIANRYRLIRKIGEGAMGVVWEAENLFTHRKVAIKLVLQASEEHRRRLLREARACGKLAHRNIIEVLDVGETPNGEPFLVMPVLSGETLADFLKRERRLMPWQVARIGRDIARALAAAHAGSVIHRDLKPANIFLHKEGGTDEVVVKVLDFGICKELDSQTTVLTAEGKMPGSIAYMSPEQLTAGASLDQAADIWSMGVVLFELLTGVRPFRGDRIEVVLKILNEEIPTVTRLVRTVPAGLSDIVSRCLTRDRAKRLGSAEELAELLHAYAHREAPPQGVGGGMMPSRPLHDSGAARPVNPTNMSHPASDTRQSLGPRGTVRLDHLTNWGCVPLAATARGAMPTEATPRSAATSVTGVSIVDRARSTGRRLYDHIGQRRRLVVGASALLLAVLSVALLLHGSPRQAPRRSLRAAVAPELGAQLAALATMREEAQATPPGPDDSAPGEAPKLPEDAASGTERPPRQPTASRAAPLDGSSSLKLAAPSRPIQTRKPARQQGCGRIINRCAPF